MRVVLAGLTVAFLVGLEITAFPAIGPSAGNVAGAVAHASLNVGLPQLESRKDESQVSKENDGESAALVKGDRLFVIRESESTADVAEDETVSEKPPALQLTTGEFCEALTKAAEDSSIPPAFFARLIWQESKFKPDARSHVGAQGVAQFMPGTAAEMGLEDPFDPRQALPASARFLRKLHDQFGNLGLAAAAYNAGSGRIQNWLARRGPLPDETRKYVRTITGTPAETWSAEAKTAALNQGLPREAPCEGIGGLSRSKEVAAIPVALTPTMSGIIRKAREEAARAAAAAKERIRLALKAGKRKSMKIIVASKASSKSAAAKSAIMKSAIIKTAALGHRKTKDARIKVASAAR